MFALGLLVMTCSLCWSQHLEMQGPEFGNSPPFREFGSGPIVAAVANACKKSELRQVSGYKG